MEHLAKRVDLSKSEKRMLRLRLRKLRIRRGITFLPNIFTLGNAFFGFSSVVFASSGNFIAAGYCILIGALMDALDGRIARLARVTSDLGLQLDSLSDAISFVFAPAILTYLWHLNRLGAFGFLSCSLFLIAGLFRLARFNLIQPGQTHYFTGTPSTIAGCFITIVLLNTASTSFFFNHLIGLLMLMLLLAGLMISTILFPTFKHSAKKNFLFLLLIGIGFLVTMGLMRVLLIVFVGYFLVAFLDCFKRFLFFKKKS
jgi:CDP-diacylglycerol---serine O-phosphatidyltransferase